jgi:hypothetical protein
MRTPETRPLVLRVSAIKVSGLFSSPELPAELREMPLED